MTEVTTAFARCVCPGRCLAFLLFAAMLCITRLTEVARNKSGEVFPYDSTPGLLGCAAAGSAGKENTKPIESDPKSGEGEEGLSGGLRGTQTVAAPSVATTQSGQTEEPPLVEPPEPGTPPPEAVVEEMPETEGVPDGSAGADAEDPREGSSTGVLQLSASKGLEEDLLIVSNLMAEILSLTQQALQKVSVIPAVLEALHCLEDTARCAATILERKRTGSDDK